MRPAAGRSGCARKVEVEREKGGGWHLLVSEIPYGVQKAKLIEQIAQLIADKKLPILADVKDESDEQVRLILEPRARTVDPDLLLESLYRLTDLEIRFPLNLNVLDATRTPGVMSLRQALTAWLAFQIEVLVRRSQVRIGKIDDRLELLDGFLIAYPQPRSGDRDHPHRGRAQAGADGRILALRPPGRSDPQHAPEAACASSRRWRSAASARRWPKSATNLSKLVESPARQRTRLKSDLAGAQGQVRRRPPDPDRGSGAGARDRLVGDDREGADHGHPVAARLDPGDEGPSRARAGRRAQMARGRRAVHPFPRADDRPAGACSPRMGGSTRWPATSSRARGVLANRCGCSSISMPRSTSSSCWWFGPK